MLGLKLTPPVKEVWQKLRENHLLTVPAGDNVLRILPPLTVQYHEIDEAIDAMEQVFAELS